METISWLYRISASVLLALLTLLTVVSISVMALHWDGVLLFLFGN